MRLIGRCDACPTVGDRRRKDARSDRSLDERLAAIVRCHKERLGPTVDVQQITVKFRVGCLRAIVSLSTL